MKNLLLGVVFLTYFSIINALPSLTSLPTTATTTPQTTTATTPATTAPSSTTPTAQVTTVPATTTATPSTTAAVSSTAAQTTSAAPAASPSMDPNLENSMLNSLSAMTYTSIENRVQVLNQLQIQAQNIYISPTVQFNYYSAMYTAYSDLLATTKVEKISLIRRFIDLVKKAAASPLLDSNQKQQAGLMIGQLIQKVSALSATTQKQSKSQTKTAKTSAQGQPFGARVR